MYQRLDRKIIDRKIKEARFPLKNTPDLDNNGDERFELRKF